MSDWFYSLEYAVEIQNIGLLIALVILGVVGIRAVVKKIKR